MTRTRATSSCRRRATSRGVYSRTDSERGVHKAPANEIVRGALGLKYNVTQGRAGPAQPEGHQRIRFMSGGIRIWGARTLSSDPSWRYINVRRLFIMVESSIERATQWVVFEPNDHRLWKRVQRTISSFLTLLWRNGALMGTTPGAGLLRQVRRRDQPARGHRRRPAGRRDRPRPGEAGRVRHLPHRPDGDRRRRRGVSRRHSRTTGPELITGRGSGRNRYDPVRGRRTRGAHGIRRWADPTAREEHDSRKRQGDLR